MFAMHYIGGYMNANVVVVIWLTAFIYMVVFSYLTRDMWL
jgi:hypothetical protein